MALDPEDERELAEWRRANGVPEPKTGRPPLRRTPRGISYRQGRPHPAQPVAAPAPAPAAPAPAAVEDQDQAPAPVTVTGGGSIGQETGGALLVLFLWPLTFNLVKGGPAQMWGWIKAKFINQPYSASGAAPSTGSTSSTPSTAPAANPAAAAAAAQGRPNPGSVASRY